MAETKKTKDDNSKSFAIALGHLKEINTKNSDYIAAFSYLQDNPPLISSDLFDMILIKAITDEFIDLNADILLMSFGLLSGYERKSRIGKRREKFLRLSNYIEDFYQNPTGAYDEVGPEQQKLYISSLIDAEKERIQNLADFLLEKKKAGTIKEYIPDLKSSSNPCKKKVILPKPNYLKYHSHKGLGSSPSTKVDFKKYWKFFVLEFVVELVIVAPYFYLIGHNVGHNQALEAANLGYNISQTEDGSVPQGRTEFIREHIQSIDRPFGQHYEEIDRETIFMEQNSEPISEPISSDSK